MAWDRLSGLRRFKKVHMIRCKTSKYGAYQCYIFSKYKDRLKQTGPVYVDILDFPEKYRLKNVTTTHSGNKIPYKYRYRYAGLKEAVFDEILSCGISRTKFSSGRFITLRCYKSGESNVKE